MELEIKSRETVLVSFNMNFIISGEAVIFIDGRKIKFTSGDYYFSDDSVRLELNEVYKAIKIHFPFSLCLRYSFSFRKEFLNIRLNSKYMRAGLLLNQISKFDFESNINDSW